MTEQDVKDVAAAIGDRDIMVMTDEIYGRLLFEGDAPQHRRRARLQGAHHHPRWLLQDLRHDRMAHGLRRDASRPGDADLAADDQLEFLHRELHADCRSRRRLRGDQSEPEKMRRGVPAAARRLRQRASTRSRASLAGCRTARSTPSPTSSRRDGRRRSWPMRCLEQAGVAALSGTAFGSFGEGYLRFSVANSIANIEWRWTALISGRRRTCRRTTRRFVSGGRSPDVPIGAGIMLDFSSCAQVAEHPESGPLFSDPFRPPGFVPATWGCAELN